TANRLRLATSKPSEMDLPEYTVSIGVATTAGNEQSMNLIARADDALYEAKRAGKDRIAIAKGLESSVAVLFTHPGSASAGA
ncbi:diguanylate cyclase domain-containing protein, partial [Noviherbaspirillum denitrificans]|uniref:diguanylate cyclase domain-containing protein n=1 Tax=Noviherbaspirillum denitrificans TaxID=1968433 RepID=UPI001131F64E